MNKILNKIELENKENENKMHRNQQKYLKLKPRNKLYYFLTYLCRISTTI